MKDEEILQELNKYAEEVLKDIDPQSTKISSQLEALKPKMQEIADREGIDITDIFIKYMDMASLQKVKLEEDFKKTMADAGVTDLGKLPL